MVLSKHERIRHRYSVVHRTGRQATRACFRRRTQKARRAGAPQADGPRVAPGLSRLAQGVIGLSRHRRTGSRAIGDARIILANTLIAAEELGAGPVSRPRFTTGYAAGQQAVEPGRPNAAATLSSSPTAVSRPAGRKRTWRLRHRAQARSWSRHWPWSEPRRYPSEPTGITPCRQRPEGARPRGIRRTRPRPGRCSGTPCRRAAHGRPRTGTWTCRGRRANDGRPWSCAGPRSHTAAPRRGACAAPP